MSNHRIFKAVSFVVLLGTAAGVAQAGSPSNWFTCGATCPARIPDLNGTTSGQVTVNLVVPPGVCSGGTFASYAVYLDVLHSHIGDLRVTLITPTAQSVPLLNPLADGSSACAGDDIGAKFRDGAGAALATCGSLIPALSGVVAPASPLSALGTSVLQGFWQLSVSDGSHGGDGQINNAALIVNCTYSDDIFNDSLELR